MSAYRTPSSPAPSGPIRKLAFPRLLNLRNVGAFPIGLFLGGMLTFLYASVEVTCARASGVCVVHEQHSVVPSSREIPIASLRGAVAEERRGGKGSRWGAVVLITDAGRENLTRSSVEASPDEARAFVEDLTGFLATPSRPSFARKMYTSIVQAIVAVFAGLLALGGVLAGALEIFTSRRGDRIEIDDGLRTLSLGGSPAGPVTVRLDDVTAVAVDAVEITERSRQAGHVAPVVVAVVTRGGERYPITTPRLDDVDLRAYRATVAAALGVG